MNMNVIATWVKKIIIVQIQTSYDDPWFNKEDCPAAYKLHTRIHEKYMVWRKKRRALLAATTTLNSKSLAGSSDRRVKQAIRNEEYI